MIIPDMLDNEFQRSELGQGEDIHCNPILLDGVSLNYQTFGLDSKGVLKLVSGDPNAPNLVQILFYIQLRRNDTVVQVSDWNFSSRSLYEVEISKVLMYARQGDHLIINPTHRKDWKAKRILKLTNPDC